MFKQERLIDWVVDRLTVYTKQIVAQRGDRPIDTSDNFILEKAGSNMDEVIESIALPKFDCRSKVENRNRARIDIDAVVLTQLRQYVSIIATAYRDNSFHNFEVSTRNDFPVLIVAYSLCCGLTPPIRSFLRCTAMLISTPVTSCKYPSMSNRFAC